MSDSAKFDLNSTAVQTHLQIYQSILARMANNSSTVKTWCVTVVSAILVLLIERQAESALPLAMIPLALFFVLDIYYLSLEKRFRYSYNCFVEDLHRCDSEKSLKLFEVSPDRRKLRYIKESSLSFSIWPFYLLIAVGICVSVAFVDSLTVVGPEGIAMFALQEFLG